MKKLAFNALLVIACALTAIGFHALFYSSPEGMIKDAQLATSEEGESTIYLQPFHVVGVTAEIEYLRSSKAIMDLWDVFNSTDELHSALDWSQANTIFAFYTFPADSESMVHVLIGYAVDDLLNEVSLTQAVVPGGTYQHYELHGINSKTVDAKWNEITNTSTLPSVVVERYAIDSLGQVQQIQMQVLFK